jgi:hypothetical protein
MRHTRFDLDQDSTIVSILAVRQAHRGSWSARQVVGMAILTATIAGLLLLYMRGTLGWH